MVRLWNLKTGLLLRVVKRHREGVRSVAFSPDGTTAGMGSDGKTIIVWDLNSGLIQDKLFGYKKAVRSAFSPNGSMIASGSGDGTMSIWKKS